MRLILPLIALLVLPGCLATRAAVDEANAELLSVREWIANNENLNEEQQVTFAAWADTIDEKLAPADLSAIGEGVAGIGRIIGGPIGTAISVIGAGAVGWGGSRKRKTVIQQLVGSIEAARTGDTVDFKKVAEVQNHMGIRGEIRDATMRVSGETA